MSYTRQYNCLWWDPPKESLPIEFCENTALHGLRYVGQAKRSIIERIFWLIAFMIGVIVACVLITGVWQKYNEAPVIITFEDKAATVSQIPFPAVTLCNVNNIQRYKALEIIRNGYSGTIEALEQVQLLHHICEGSQVRFSHKFGYGANGTLIPNELLQKVSELELNNSFTLNTTIKEFLELNTQKCDDMILLCRWDDTIQDCDELFDPIATDFGKCCSFNFIPSRLLHRFDTGDSYHEEDLAGWADSMLNTDELYTYDLQIDNNKPHRKYPRRLKSAGQTNGLSILVNPGIKDYFCTTADFIGLELLAHLSITTPHVVDFGSAIHQNEEIFVNISPDIINAEASIYEFDVEKRSCYFDGEFTLKYYKYYTFSNCMDECMTNITFIKCNCVRYYMPRDLHQPVCGIQSFNCVDIVEEEFRDKYSHRNCSHCLPTCNDVNYHLEIHSGRLRNDVEIWLKNNQTIKENWAELQVSIVHIFFGQHVSFPKIRKQLYGLTDLVASTGGLLGLCLGFSALSLLEVVYFLTLRLLFTILRRRRFAEISEAEDIVSHNELRKKIFTNVSNNTVYPVLTTNPIISPIQYDPNLLRKQELINLYRKESKPIIYEELLVRGMFSPYQYRP